MKSMKILKTILVFTTLLITACQSNKKVEDISRPQSSSVYIEDSSKNDNVLSTTDVSTDYVYCHFEDFESIEPIHVKATGYEEISEVTMYTWVQTYYKFTLENSEQTPTFRTEDCTLFYDTYCPVCQKEIDNYLN